MRTINLDESLRHDIELFQRVLSNLKLVQQRLSKLKAGRVKLSDDDIWIETQIAEQIAFLEARILEFTGNTS